jgi:hypothetical protein
MTVYDYSLDDGYAAIARGEAQLEQRENTRPDHIDLGDLYAGFEQAVAAVDDEITTRLARILGVLR